MTTTTTTTTTIVVISYSSIVTTSLLLLWWFCSEWSYIRVNLIIKQAVRCSLLLLLFLLMMTNASETIMRLEFQRNSMVYKSNQNSNPNPNRTEPERNKIYQNDKIYRIYIKYIYYNRRRRCYYDLFSFFHFMDREMEREKKKELPW